MNLSALLASLFMILMVGCMPYPHRYPSLPNVSGKITDNGLPLEGVQVSLGETSEKGSCNLMKGPVTSAKDGSFSIEGEKRLRFYVVLLPAHSFETWMVCIKQKDKEQLIYARRRYQAGPPYSPESVKLLCDLSLSKFCEITEETVGEWPYGPRKR